MDSKAIIKAWEKHSDKIRGGNYGGQWVLMQDDGYWDAVAEQFCKRHHLTLRQLEDAMDEVYEQDYSALDPFGR